MNNKRRDLIKKMTVSQQFVTQAEDNAKMDKVRRYAPLILLVIMTAIGGISQKNFFSWANIVNIMFQMSIPLVISVGLSFVLLLGSIDLSIEGNMGFAGSLVAFLVVNNSNSNNFGIFGVLIAILIGLAVGTVVGFLHTKGRIASFIVSYAVGCIMTGAAVLIYRGTPIQVKDPMFIAISQGRLLGIPYITLISFAVFIIGTIIMNYTAFGRAVFAIGDNEAASADQGDLIIPVVITVYADRSFSFVTKTPPAAVLLKKACKIKSGSATPNKTKVATISKADLQKIAETKMPDLNAASLEAAMSMIAGTARSMGITVEE